MRLDGLSLSMRMVSRFPRTVIPFIFDATCSATGVEISTIECVSRSSIFPI